MSELTPAVLESIYRVIGLKDESGAPRSPEEIEVELGMNTKEGYIISYILQAHGLIIMSLVMTGGPSSGPQDFQTIGGRQ